MKLKILTACFLLACLASSCIKDEALNSEAAIDACTGSNIQQATIDYDNFTIQIYISKGLDLSAININFQVPQGAVVTPDPSVAGDNVEYSLYNFKDNNPRKFKVTSEDKQISAVYTITVWQTEMPDNYHFETLSSNNPFDVFYEQEDVVVGNEIIPRRLEWASGNPGFKLTVEAKTPQDYPTLQATGGVNGGKCLKLVTRSTGSLGVMSKMYLAAGNMFIGSFDGGAAMSDAMKATHFGFPYFKIPTKLEGYYKYKAGDQYSSGGKIVEGKIDNCDIYGVLYETTESLSFLDGSNSLSSPNIIALARTQNGFLPEADTWTPFSLDFITKSGKSIDKDKLNKGIYKLAIVFSSSVDGAKFSGAVGSTLYVDEVTLTSNKPQ